MNKKPSKFADQKLSTGEVNLVIRGLFICEFAYSHLKY
jgi:hypothetical protein